jgi:hypothetical protein
LFPTNTTSVPQPRLPSVPPPTVTHLRVQGTIQSVNLGWGTVTIAPEGREAVTMSIIGNTMIQKNGQPAQLQDLKPGDMAFAGYSTSGSALIALRITAQYAGKQISGWLDQVDSQRKLSIHAADGTPFLFQLGAQSAIYINGQQVPFARLTPGHNVLVTYQLSEGRALPVVVKLEVY